MKRYNIFFLLFFFLLLLTACNRPPKEVLSEDKMEAVLFDIHLAEGTFDVNDFSKLSETKKHYYKYLLDKQSVSVARFDTSIAWYSMHLDIYDRVYEKVIERLKQRKIDIEEGVYPLPLDSLTSDSLKADSLSSALNK